MFEHRVQGPFLLSAEMHFCPTFSHFGFRRQVALCTWHQLPLGPDLQSSLHLQSRGLSSSSSESSSESSSDSE